MFVILTLLLPTIMHSFRGTFSLSRYRYFRHHTSLRDVHTFPTLVNVKNTQRKFSIDEHAMIMKVKEIASFLNVSDFQIDIWFCSENKIRELNKEWRGVNKATDVLSFPSFNFHSPEVFESDATFEFMKHLGDIVIAPAYVNRQMKKDEDFHWDLSQDYPGNDNDNHHSHHDSDGDGVDKANVRFISSSLSNPATTLPYKDDGVSLTMSKTFVLEERLHLLLIHSCLHLLGYDHENEDDWKIMTRKENQLIKMIKTNESKD